MLHQCFLLILLLLLIYCIDVVYLLFFLLFWHGVEGSPSQARVLTSEWLRVEGDMAMAQFPLILEERWTDVWRLFTVLRLWPRGSQISQPSTLKLMLLNARSVSNKSQIIQDLILEEDADLACITETWMGGEGGVPLTLACRPGYAVQH